MKCPIVCYGEIDLDRYLAVDTLPGPEIAANVRQEFYNVGGAAGNAAIWLAHWGVPVRLVGHELGDDPFGDQVRQLLALYPMLDSRYVQYNPDRLTPRCQCLVTPDGERTFIMHWLDEVRVSELTTDMLHGVKWLNLDMSGELEPRLEAAKLARAHHLPVLVNDVYAEDHPLVGLVDVIVISASMLQAKLPNRSPLDVAHLLRRQGDCDVIVTNGSKPVHAFLKAGHELTLFPPEINPIDSTGAGDIFKAGLLYGLVQGFPTKTALKWAIAAGAAKAERAGTTANPAALSTVRELVQKVSEKT